MRRKRRDVVRNKLAAQRAPANSAFLMNPQSWWQDKHQQWIQKGVSDTWINSWGKQKSSRSSLLKEKKTTKNKGPWVERRRKNTGKACSCRKINVILRDNGKIERRQNFLTQILWSSFLVTRGVQQWNKLPGKVVIFLDIERVQAMAGKITGQGAEPSGSGSQRFLCSGGLGTWVLQKGPESLSCTKEVPLGQTLLSQFIACYLISDSLPSSFGLVFYLIGS